MIDDISQILNDSIYNIIIAFLNLNNTRDWIAFKMAFSIHAIS